MIKSIYRAGKHIPGLNILLPLLRKEYFASAFYLRILARRDQTKAKEVSLALFGDSGPAYVDEFVSSDIFKNEWSFGHSGDFDVIFLYVATRAMKPEVVVETGVASGRSSAAILAALDKNKKGILYSIDLAQEYQTEVPGTYITHEGNEELNAFVPAGKQPGWLVPENLRPRWNLIIGDAKKELVALVDELDKKIDIFYHDSDHSEDHMLFEFDTAFSKLSDNSLLISDDVRWNNAWDNFVKEKNLNQVCIYRNLGIAKK